MFPLRLVPLVLALPLAAQDPALRLAAVFGDHMVLQQQADVAVWGWDRPGTEVTVAPSWNRSAGLARAGADGRWQVELATPAAGGPHTITVQGSGERLLRDVLIGEVWLCSGQSNMEWPMTNVRDARKEIAAAEDQQLRLFKVRHAYVPEPALDCAGTWQVCSPETVGGFSAVAYFFARELRRELGVPVGLVGTHWGGTRCEAWTSALGLQGLPAFDRRVAALKALAGEGQEARAQRQATARAAWWQQVAAAGTRGPDLEVAVPGVLGGEDLAGFDGVLWLRRTVVVPAAWAGRELVVELGAVDDMDTTYWNGTKIGGLEEPGRSRAPRRYTVPGGLVAGGEQELGVRVVDTGGAAGIIAKDGLPRLVLADGTGEALPLAGTWRCSKGATMAGLGRFPRDRSIGRNDPTALFNGMIAPLVPFSVRGFLWYQGEANRAQFAQYRELFPAMIRDWRRQWGAELPFYFVQIAPFGYGGDRGEAAALREAQLLTQALPKTGMAVIMDIGNPENIHPRNKQDVGQRLALWALGKTYGRDAVECSGPVYTGHGLAGQEMHLRFAHAQGLRALGGTLTGFTVSGGDGVFHPATARIEGETVVVRSEQVTVAAAVRYCWGAADAGTLVNGAGLPASSFRTDLGEPVTNR